MQIGEVSKKYCISAETLRYYEKIGLIPKVPKSTSGIRVYGQEECNWINFIVKMRKAGLSIESLKSYTTLFNAGTTTIAKRKEILIQQHQKLQEEVEQMTQVMQLLEQKIDGYEERLLKYEHEKLQPFNQN